MKFNQNFWRFCSKFVWRKICVEKIGLEKKWLIWGLDGSFLLTLTQSDSLWLWPCVQITQWLVICRLKRGDPGMWGYKLSTYFCGWQLIKAAKAVVSWWSMSKVFIECKHLGGRFDNVWIVNPFRLWCQIVNSPFVRSFAPWRQIVNPSPLTSSQLPSASPVSSFLYLLLSTYPLNHHHHLSHYHHYCQCYVHHARLSSMWHPIITLSICVYS